MSDLLFDSGNEWSQRTQNMQTTDEFIDWLLTVLSSEHLTEEDLVKWWNEEIQFAIPHFEEK